MDEKKDEANIRKHGVGFADATRIFSQPTLTYFDASDEKGEDRYIAVGWLEQRLLTVVFVERGEDVVRIISARKATRSEARFYERGY